MTDAVAPPRPAVRNTFLDFAKGVLILLVVTGHSLQFVVFQDQDATFSPHWSNPLYKAIYLFHMPLFMAISGFLSQRGIDRQELKPFVLGKLQSYVIPILVWAAIFCTAVHLFAHEGIKAWAMAIAHEATGTSFWFLWALLGSLILTAILHKCGKAFLPLYIVSSFAVLALPDKGIIYLFQYTYAFFQIGYLVSRYGIPGVVRRHQGVVLGVAALLTALCYWHWQADTYVYITRMTLAHGNWQTVLFRFATGVIASLFALLLMLRVYHWIPAARLRLIEAFGQDSIYIYILQGYLILFLKLIVIRFSVPIPGQALAAVIAVALSFPLTWCCWVLGNALSRNYWYGRLLFGKTKRPPRAAEPAGAGS